MKIEIDLSGTNNPVDDLDFILNCHRAVNNLISPSTDLQENDREHLYSLFELLNSIQRKLIDKI